MEATTDTTPAPVSTDSSAIAATGASERPATARIAVVKIANPSETASLPRRERLMRTTTDHAASSPSLTGRRRAQKELVGVSKFIEARRSGPQRSMNP